MTTYQSPIVVGIFQDETQARSAVETLRSANFAHDQIGVAIQNNGPAELDLCNDLMSLGVSQERASYYDKEFREGHIVVSVRPDGREQEVRNILDHHGAYDYRNGERQAVAGDEADNYNWSNVSTYATNAPEGTSDTFGQSDYRQSGNYGEGVTYAPDADRYRNGSRNTQ